MEGDELRAAALDGSLEHLMEWIPVKAGDWFHIAPGTVHAIGAGITIVEIQQNSDITYRLFDYGRPRELHLDRGVFASRAAPYRDVRCGSLHQDQSLSLRNLSSGACFSILAGSGDNVQQLDNEAHWIVPLSGQLECSHSVCGIGSVLFGVPTSEHIPSVDFLFLAAKGNNARQVSSE
jgi:mannose-6-phosphate isomerase